MPGFQQHPQQTFGPEWPAWPGGLPPLDPVTPTGIPSTTTVGSPSLSLTVNLAGMGIPSTATVGIPTLLLEDRPVSVFIGGVNRSAWVELGIKRALRITGGSKGTCSFTINNKDRVLFRPSQGDEVLIYLRSGERFFAGVVDKIAEFNYTGTSNLTTIDIDCVDFGVLMDRVVIGREVQTQV